MAFLGRIKQLASETAIYGISTIVGRLVNYLLVPIYLNVFVPELYQVVILVFTAFAVLNHIYQHGMEAAYLKYASSAEGRLTIKKTFSTATWSLLGLSACASGLLILGQNPLSNLIGIGTNWAYLFYYAAGILTLDALSIVPFAELRLQNRPYYFAAIKLVNIALNVGFNLFLIFGLGMGVESVFIANLIASAGTLLLLIPLYFKLWDSSFDGHLWKQLMAFGLPFIPSGISYAFVDRINTIFLDKMDPARVIELYGDFLPARVLFSSPEAGGSLPTDYIVGVFGGVWKLGVFMMLVAQMFRFAWQPFFLQHAEDEDAQPLFARIFTLYTAASLFVLLAISFFIDELVSIRIPNRGPLIPEEYWFALYLVPVILLAYFFQGWYYNFTAGAYIKKQTKYFATCTFAGALLALAINLFAVPHFGMIAAAWATTLAYALMAFLLFSIAKRFYPVPYRWSEVFRSCILAAGIYAAWYFTPTAQVWWKEALLLLGFIAGLFIMRIVSLKQAFSIVKSRNKD
ncbi:MAG: lipopolysaccharide biosynthesis protein [Rhodothermales bacterium]